MGVNWWWKEDGMEKGKEERGTRRASESKQPRNWEAESETLPSRKNRLQVVFIQFWLLLKIVLKEYFSEPKIDKETRMNGKLLGPLVVKGFQRINIESLLCRWFKSS